MTRPKSQASARRACSGARFSQTSDSCSRHRGAREAGRERKPKLIVQVIIVAIILVIVISSIMVVVILVLITVAGVVL